MKHMQLLMPMSGTGSRFRAAGYNMPKPLIPINGVPIIQRMLKLYPSDWHCTFVLSAADKDSGLEELLKLLRSQSQIIYIDPHKLGPGAAIAQALPQLVSDAPVFVSYCDFGMVWDAPAFEKFVAQSDCDACVLSYQGFHAHYLGPQMYAYSRMVDGRVVEIKEKGSFTPDREAELASVGAYYFKSAKILGEALSKQRELDLTHGGELYTSLTVEALIRARPTANVNAFEVPYFFQWGTPADLEDFAYWERCFRWFNKNKVQNKRGHISQVLMPMAGRGSRFSDLFPSTPKPFLEWSGEPMFKKALNSMPISAKNVFVLLNDHKKFFEAYKESIDHAIYLKETPAGQALSVETGVPALNVDQDVIVTACDHAIVIAPETWDAFKALPAVDAAVFTIKGLPAARRYARAFAYVECESDETFARVARVSVKEPISARPIDDALLVGTFWFSDREILRTGIEKLKQKDIRVNGELYLDSILNELIALGLNVRNIPLEGYIGWGDPDTLAESLYWEEVYTGPRSVAEKPRLRYGRLS